MTGINIPPTQRAATREVPASPHEMLPMHSRYDVRPLRLPRNRAERRRCIENSRVFTAWAEEVSPTSPLRRRFETASRREGHRGGV
jgi:hypothetical protein